MSSINLIKHDKNWICGKPGRDLAGFLLDLERRSVMASQVVLTLIFFFVGYGYKVIGVDIGIGGYSFDRVWLLLLGAVP